MKRCATFRVFMQIVHLTAIMTMFTFAQMVSAEDTPLTASPPDTLYYTTNGATTSVPTSDATTNPPVPTSESSEKIKNDNKNKELKEKLLKKYDIYKDTFTIRLEHTQHGSSGYINMRYKESPGSINYKTSSIIKENYHSHVHAIVREFLKEEVELFRITDLDELRETRYEIDDLGFTLIEFQRYISKLPLENSRILFFIRATGEISEVSAKLILAPPELYEAANKEHIPESRAREIAEVALRELNYDANTNLSIRRHMRTGKIAISSSPYVLWKVESYWNILIDAFSGAVVEKIPNFMR